MYTLGVILAQGVTFLLVQVLFPRVITNPADFTEINLYAMWANVFASIIGLQAASSVNNARIDFGIENLASYTSSLVGIGLIMLGVICGLVAVFTPAITSFTGFPLYVVFSFLAQGFFYFCVMLNAEKCRVLYMPLQFVLWTALVCILRLVFSMIFVTHIKENQYLGDVAGSLIANGIVGIAAITSMYKRGRKIADIKNWKYCLNISVPIVFHTLSSMILAQSDQQMLKMMIGEQKTAPYSYAYNMSALANAVWLAFNNAWAVWYFDRVNEGNNTLIVDLYKKYALFVTLFNAAVLLVAPDLIVWLGGADYVQGANIIPIMMIGCFFMFLYTFPVNYESYAKKTKFIALGTTCAALVNIGLNFWFIPNLGITGAAITTLIAYGMLFLFHYLIVKFIIKGFQIDLKNLLLPALFIVGVAALTYLFMNLWGLRWILALCALTFSFILYRKSKDVIM